MKEPYRDKILVVEDDIAISRGIIHNLEYEGYETRLVSHGGAFFPVFDEFKPDLIVLDLMLPGTSGFEILEELALRSSDVRIIIVSAKSEEAEKVLGLKLGADDYVTKPFALREFLARVQANLRRVRARKQIASSISFDDIELDLEKGTIIKNKQAVKLTPKAYDLFVFLVTHPQRIFSRDDLLHFVWQDSYEGTTRTIDNFVLQIRNQIEDDTQNPKYLETIHGKGYRFNR